MDVSLIVKLLLNSTIMASILFFLILLLKRVFRNRLGAGWHYLIWFVFVLRLAVPYAAYSPLNLSDLFQSAGIESGAMGDVDLQASSVSSKSQDTKDSRYTEVPGINRSDNEYPNKDVQSFSFSNTLQRFLTMVNKINIDYSMLFYVWLTVVIAFSLYSFLFNIYFWSRVKNGKAFIEQKVISLLEECKEELGIKTNVSIIKTSGVNIPAIFGVTRPWLLMPENVLEGLKQDELRFVILHELAHLKRRDIVVNWLAFILQIIHWFNPLVWLAFHRMRLDRELACDEAVLKHLEQDEAKKYGHTILDMAEIVSQKVSYAGIAGILENKSRLRDRIIMISRFAGKKKPIPLAGVAVALLLASSVIVNADNYTDYAAMKETSTNSEIAAGNRIDGNSGNRTVSTGAGRNAPTSDISAQVQDTAQMPDKVAQAKDSSQIPGTAAQTSETAGYEAGSSASGGEIVNPDRSPLTGKGTDTRQTDSNTPETVQGPASARADNAVTKAAGSDSADEQIRSMIGVRVTKGVTVTESFTLRKIVIDTKKLPSEFPEMLRVSVIRTEAASDLDILNMITHHRQQKTVSPAIDTKSDLNTYWEDRNFKYSVILFFDMDMNYLGYYVYEKPESESGASANEGDTESNQIDSNAPETKPDTDYAASGDKQTGYETPEAGAENGQLGSLGLKVTQGITVTAESSDYFAVYIDKSKLPSEIPDQIRMFMTVTNDRSDVNISSLAYRYMSLKSDNMPFEGKPVEYFHFQKSDSKYIVIFIYDADFYYIGYSIHENPIK